MALKTTRAALGLSAVLLFLSVPPIHAQDSDRDRPQDQDRDRDRDRDWDRDRQLYTRLSSGTTIPVRTLDAIDVQRTDDRVFRGIVDQDVAGENGRLAIPRGSTVELIVRVAPDNDLILDLDSVAIHGERYAVKAEPDREESQPDRSVIGTIMGAINGGEVRGRAVRIPRDSVVTFRLARPLNIGVPDRGETREGTHYHDYWRDRPDPHQ